MVTGDLLPCMDTLHDFPTQNLSLCELYHIWPQAFAGATSH